jgi:hypothetical protein
MAGALTAHVESRQAAQFFIDQLMVEPLAATCNQEEIVRAFEEYLEIGGFLDAGLKQQTEFALDSPEHATTHALSSTEREQFMTLQHQANRWTYPGSGMTQPKFLATLEKIQPATRTRLEQIVPAFC